MAKFDYSKVGKDNDPNQIQVGDFVNALNDIAEVAPDLIEYILTCYPPELMIDHISPEICQHLDRLRKSSYPPEKEDS